MVWVPDAKSDYSCWGEAEVRILNFKTTWSEFHHLPIVGPKQLCALEYLGCVRKAGTSKFFNIFSPGSGQNKNCLKKQQAPNAFYVFVFKGSRLAGFFFFSSDIHCPKGFTSSRSRGRKAGEIARRRRDTTTPKMKEPQYVLGSWWHVFLVTLLFFLAIQLCRMKMAPLI